MRCRIIKIYGGYHDGQKIEIYDDLKILSLTNYKGDIIKYRKLEMKFRKQDGMAILEKEFDDIFIPDELPNYADDMISKIIEKEMNTEWKVFRYLSIQEIWGLK